MDKKNYFYIALALICSIASTLLLIFLAPSSVPVHISFDEKIMALGSKWFMLIVTLLPFILGICLIFLKKYQFLAGIIKALIVTFIYINMLSFIILLAGEPRCVGELVEIPLTCFTFLPLAMLYFILGIKLRNLPYGSKVGIRNKFTREVQFIWTQTHFFASRVISLSGLFLVILSFIFSFFHLAYVMFAIFIVAIIVDFTIIYVNSKAMYKKYSDMKARQDRMNAKKKA